MKVDYQTPVALTLMVEQWLEISVALVVAEGELQRSRPDYASDCHHAWSILRIAREAAGIA